MSYNIPFTPIPDKDSKNNNKQRTVKKNKKKIYKGVRIIKNIKKNQTNSK